MQVIKPNSLSLLKQTYYLKQQQFVVSALSFFKLGEENGLLPENEQWPRLQPYLDAGVILDTGHAKGCAEWLLAGCAYSTDEKPVQKMEVKVAIDKSDKVIEVVGDRIYGRMNLLDIQQDSTITPFTKMPLGFAQSYGGVGYDKNQMGKGRLDKQNFDAKIKGHRLANLYVKGESIKADKQARTEACFLPREFTHPERAQYQGTYNKKWLKDIHPGFPDDTDLKLFNSAPQAQQQETFFLPNSCYELNGVHPQKSIIKGRLPSIVVRAFVTQTEASGCHFKEIDTHIDTVWFFPELELGIAIHRGVLAVKDSLGLDIKNLLLALEKNTDVPRKLDYYQQVLQQRLDSKTAAGNAFNASQLLPQLTEEEQTERIKLYAQALAMQEHKQVQQRYKQLKKLQKQHPHLDWQTIEQNGIEQGNKNKIQHESPPAPIPQALLKKGDFDLTPYIEWSRKQEAMVKAKGRQKLQELQFLKKQQAQPESNIESEASILLRSEHVVLIQSGKTVSSKLIPDDTRVEEKKVYLQKVMQESTRRARQLSPVVTQTEIVDTIGSKILRQKVLSLLEQNQSLAGRDLMGADLSGLDLTGQNLRDVMLEQANLEGTQFSYALCDGLVLVGAKLDGACFTGCRLIKANLSAVNCQKAQFNNCLFDHCLMIESEFEQCDFTAAKFNKMNWVSSKIKHCLFSQSQWLGVQVVESCLKSSSWKQATLTQSTFLLCDLTESQWQHSKIERCSFLKTIFNRVDFSYLVADRVQISTIKALIQCSFYKSRWQYCGWRELHFQHCVLSQAAFICCDFSFAHILQSDFDKTLWQGSLLLKVHFSQAGGAKALFYETNLCKADFNTVSLSSVTFHQTDLNEAQFDQCHMPNVTCYPLSSMEKATGW